MTVMSSPNGPVKLDKEDIEHKDFREMPRMSYFSFFGKMEERSNMGGGH